MAKPKTYSWADPRSLTRFALAILALDLLYDVWGLVMTLIWGRQLDYKTTPLPELSPIQAMAFLHDLAGLITLLGAVVLLLWILRASKNAHALKRRPLENSPMFAALWWYLIPIMSLFKPVESISEIWDASAPSHAAAKPGRAAIVIWWGGVIAYAMTAFAAGIGPVLVELNQVASIVRCVAFAYIVRRICAMQLEKHALPINESDPPLNVLERLSG